MNSDSFSTKATLLLLSSLTVMSGATIAPALPSMEAHFSGGEYIDWWIRFVLTVPALFIVISAPVAGILVDRWGRKKLLVPALFLYSIAGSSGLYLESLGMILAGRALLGVAVAGIMTTATTLIADYYEGATRAKVMGWQAAFMSFGGMIFLLGGGLLAEVSWRWPFAIYLTSLIMLPLAVWLLPTPGRSGDETGPKNTTIREVGWARLKLPLFIYSVLLIGVSMFYFVPLQLPFYLESQSGAGPLASGVAIGVSTLFGTVTSFTYGRIRARLGYVTILSFTFGLIGAGFLVIGFTTEYFTIMSGLVFTGLGMGLLFPNLSMWLTTETPAIIRGRIVAGFTMCIFLGQFISPMISQPVIRLAGLEVMYWSTGIFLLAVASGLLIWRRAILMFTRQTGLQTDDQESAGTTSAATGLYPHHTDKLPVKLQKEE